VVVEQLNLFYLTFAFFPHQRGAKVEKKRDVCLNALSFFFFWSKEAVEHKTTFEFKILNCFWLTFKREEKS
jgi:hypothetical protein